MKKQNIWKESFLSLKTVRGIALSAMFIAISCVLSFFKLGITQNVNITFFFLPISIAAMLLGPLPAAAVGGIADLLGCIIRPTGPYFPGFTLNAVVTGIVYGLFFYKKRPKLWVVIAARLIIMIAVDLILTPLWLHILYSTPLVWAFWVERLIKCAIVCPIEIVSIFAATTAASRLIKKL
ncbi:MAG: folate family ECF transporter S component [Oscillospiraceae bacterium]|nr:folate family ECF transporter S component [Oscillospiraceae bacterium]